MGNMNISLNVTADFLLNTYHVPVTRPRYIPVTMPRDLHVLFYLILAVSYKTVNCYCSCFLEEETEPLRGNLPKGMELV